MPKNLEIQILQPADLAETPGSIILLQEGPNGSWGILEILMPKVLKQNSPSTQPSGLHMVALHKGEKPILKCL